MIKAISPVKHIRSNICMDAYVNISGAYCVPKQKTFQEICPLY